MHSTSRLAHRLCLETALLRSASAAAGAAGAQACARLFSRGEDMLSHGRRGGSERLLSIAAASPPGAAPRGTATVEASTAVQPPFTGTKLFVGGFSWHVTADRLAAHFASAGGKVKGAQVLMRGDGKSKGCGIVEFENHADCVKALETFHHSTFKGRIIAVKPYLDVAAKRGASGSRQEGAAGGTAAGPVYELFVGNLAWSVTWQALKAAFADHLPTFALVRTGEDGRSRGWGIVRFSSADDARAALRALHGAVLEGRAIEVREHADKPLGGGSGGGGTSRQDA